jgi:Tfp pilus assembly protein PilX
MQQRTRPGQVGLILLVVMGVLIALVMSLASRSLSDTVLSRQEQESSSAFNLAESGVEAALNALRQGNDPGTGVPLTSGIFSGTYGVQNTPTLGLYVKELEVAHLDLTGLVGPVTITWTRQNVANEDPSTCAEGSGLAPAALEVQALRGSGQTSQFSYYNAHGCTLSNGFAASNDGGADYVSTVSYTPPAGTVALRLRPIYNGATIQVAGAGMSTQLYLIQARAAGGDAQKEIEVRRGLDAPGAVFDFALFSGTTIVK